jgi:putative tricarboxylic transport membrane protein
VTREEVVEAVGPPTLTDEGVDLVFANWRGIVAAPGITEEETQRFVDAMTEMHDSDAWKQVLEDQGWVDAFMTGDEFSAFLGDESDRVEGVLSGLGLA